MMGLVSAGKSLAEETLSMLQAEGSLAVTLTYKKYLSEAFDESLGHNVSTFDTPVSITAVKMTYTERAVSSAGSSKIKVGDIAYIFRRSLLSDPDISSNDEWYEGTSQLTVKLKTDIWDFMLLSCDGEADA